MPRLSPRLLFPLFSLILLSFALPALAAVHDAPSVSVDAVGHGKVRLTITAGSSGAPQGFGILWMKENEFGGEWPADLSHSGLDWSMFTGTPTLNTFDQLADFALDPFESIQIEIGDLEGETGILSNDRGELESAVRYVLTAFVREGEDLSQSTYADNVAAMPTTQGENCTFTIGYWKTHGPGDCVSGNNANEWPVAGLTLGTVNYTDLELCSIFNANPQGNGLISLAHQLIAAKLNVANGAQPDAGVADCISNADALIGALVVPPVGTDELSPGTTSALTQCLDDFNNGLSGTPHCTVVPTHNSTWGRVKSIYR